MGFLDIFRKKHKENNELRYAPTMTGVTPSYSDFGYSIYASDIIVQSIRCKANEFKKLQPRHIVTSDGKEGVNYTSSIARILKRPNEFMTIADFLEKITILLELNKNAYIYPEYYIDNQGKKQFTAFYPLKPSTVDYLSDDAGKLYIKFTFSNGYNVTLHASDVIHWRKDYGVNDYFGGGMLGGDDNTGLLKMLRQYDKLIQSIAIALDCSCKINGIVKYNSYLDDEKLKTKEGEFQDRLKNNESGVLFTSQSTEYVHIPRDIKLVDAETLKFFYDTILRANGTPLAILNGDYTKSQKEAYYEHALEADIKSLGQAISKVVFSEREESFGNEVKMYPNSIEFMSMENKLSALEKGLPAGLFRRNEARELIGYPPLSTEEGGDEIPRAFNSLDNQGQKTNNQNTDGGDTDATIK